MRTQDLFKSNRSAQRLNESLSKTFGKKINFEQFNLDQLQDARNKLRTQLSQARSESGFNENLENDAFHQAQWMLDAINAEIAERDEHIIESDVEEGFSNEVDMELHRIAKSEDEEMLIDALGGLLGTRVADALEDMKEELADELASKGMNDVMRDEDKMVELLMDKIVDEYSDGDFDSDEGGETDDNYALASAGFGSDEDYESIQFEKAPPGAKAERMVKHIKKGYAKDGKLTDKEKSIAYATAWKQHNKEKNEDMNTNEAYINNAKDAIDVLADIRKQSKMAELGQGEPVRPNQLVNDLWDVMQWIEHNMDESIETESVENSGEDMTTLREGEVQQASAIVTAKTMVDRVGRWIEELSGMENETLLQLGDSIRDEMGQEQAKAFIEACAPAIQQALENLKATRDTLSGSVRSLASGEQPADMLGAEPAAGGEEEMPAAEPDAMNAEPTEEPAGDEFAAAEPAAGGLEAPGREQRESINYENRLLKVLAG